MRALEFRKWLPSCLEITIISEFITGRKKECVENRS